MQLNALADQVVVLVKNALGPLVERITGMEARLSVLGDLRDRVVTVETKAAMPVPAVDLAPVLERLSAVERQRSLPPELTQDAGALCERIAGLEARLSVLGDLRDRVVVVETKAAMSPPAPPDLADLMEHVSGLRHRVLGLETKAGLFDVSDLTKDLGSLRERVAVLEVRPSLPGPPGEPGPSGTDGTDGKDGSAGLSFEGVYQDGKSYELGHLVTWAGSSWHCNEPTTTKPGDGSKAWTLMVKRGQNGRDGRDAPGALPVVSVGRPQ